MDDRELLDLFAEIYSYNETGVLHGDKLRNLSMQRFKAYDMVRVYEDKILFEMARRYANMLSSGGQDAKVLRLDGNGRLISFLMNDKCSAGTGRFLEVMANTLSVRLEELCELARMGGGVSISSMCTVFAESEVIGLIGKGEKRENIAYAVVNSIVQKVASQAGRLKLDQTVCLTGGLCEFEYLRNQLGKALRCEVIACPDGRYAGAAGAAITASQLR